MSEKRRVNIYINKRIYELLHLETNNVSRTIEELLEAYLATNSLEDINKKIHDHEVKIRALLEKKKDLLQAGIAETKQEGLNDTIWKGLQTTYQKRKKQGSDRASDENWITSPKNLIKCKTIGKEPLLALKELSDGY